MASRKPAPVEGVALNIGNTRDRFGDGVAVSVPEDASTTESKSGQKAAPTKEKS